MNLAYTPLSSEARKEHGWVEVTGADTVVANDNQEVNMRKYRRMVAKAKMKKKGLVQFCKPKADGSCFSRHWREYV